MRDNLILRARDSQPVVYEITSSEIIHFEEQHFLFLRFYHACVSLVQTFFNRFQASKFGNLRSL